MSRRRGFGHRRQRVVPVSWLVAAFAVLLLVIATSAFTAANVVAPTKAGDSNNVTTADDMKPDECANIDLDTIISGSNNVTGTASSELILGSASADVFDGADGDDCLVGGDANDTLTGGPGTDVCIGGGGTDTLDATCETQIP